MPSSASATADCAGQVLVSGSYGGEYNAWHAAKWGLRGVILNDAGVGFGGAGISGLAYLDAIRHAVRDGRRLHRPHRRPRGHAHARRHQPRQRGGAGTRLRARQIARGQCAERMRAGPVVRGELRPIEGGKRYTIREAPGEPKVVCLDAAPMLTPEDAGAIAITGSHAALFRGRPDNVIGPDLYAVFFNDAGVGKDQAGIFRLADLDLARHRGRHRFGRIRRRSATRGRAMSAACSPM